MNAILLLFGALRRGLSRAVVLVIVLGVTAPLYAQYYANGSAALALYPNALLLYRSPGGAVSDQWLSVWNAGTGIVQYTATATDTWIASVVPTNGVTSAGAVTAHRVALSPTGLGAGMQAGRVWLAAPAATNTPQYLQIWLDTLASGVFGNVFLRHVVTNTPGSQVVDCAIAADVDRDGLLDLAAAYGDAIAWWRNDGGLTFTNMQVIDGNFGDAMNVAIGDMDNDGDNDVLGVAYTDNDVAWWENNGRMQFVEHAIELNFNGANRALLADMDGDWDLDVVASAYNAGDIAWWRNDGGGAFTNRINLDAAFGGVRNILVRDLDGDGTLDVAGAGATADALAWWHRTGAVSFAKIVIASNYPGAYAIDAADFDRDGDMDFIGSALDDNEISWFENTGSYSNFIKHQIVWDVDSYDVKAADVDNDGDMDFFANDNPAQNDFFWCQNDGAQNFTRRNIDTTHDLTTICVVDLDGNGWLDAVGGNNSRVTWFQSGGTAVLEIVRAPAMLAQETLVGVNATQQWFHISNGGQFGLLEYTASEPVTWMTSLTPSGGTCTNDRVNTHRVTFATTSLGEGSYQTNITIAAGAAVNTPQAIQVIVDVVPEPAVWALLAVWLGARPRALR